jgi:anti-anti-sigma regulatory factor
MMNSTNEIRPISTTEIENRDGLYIYKFPRIDLDFSDTPALRQSFLNTLQSSDFRSLIIDFTNITFADAAVCGMLVATAKRVSKHPNQCTMVIDIMGNEERSVRRIFSFQDFYKNVGAFVISDQAFEGNP